MSRDADKAVLLFSGGLDSTTALAMAKEAGFDIYALTVDYGQRHRLEIDAARRIAREMGVVEHQIVPLNLTVFGGSALTDEAIAVPDTPGQGIPVTYVPARNTIFLSLALAWAEVLQSFDLYIGVNAVDYSGYPDCRSAFIEAFEHMAQLATKAGVERQGRYRIHTPLVHLSKAEIIRTGHRLGVDYSLTLSCYDLDERSRACGVCDACRLRRKGFEEAGIDDPTVYR